MKVSKQVEDSVQEAIASLRNALAFAARSEKPFISKHIAVFLADIDNLIDANDMMDNLRKQLVNREEEE